MYVPGVLYSSSDSDLLLFSSLHLVRISHVAAANDLIQHILKRTNTENIIPQKLRNPDSPNPDVGGPVSPVLGPPRKQFTPEIARSDSNPTKEKK